MRKPVKDYRGWIVGWLDYLPNGNVVAYDYNQYRVGEFVKSMNITKDRYDRVIAEGDITTSLVLTADSNRR